jgi:hypothetical protein
MNTRTEYEKARAEPKRRQDFLEGVDMEIYDPFVKAMEYISGEKALMAAGIPVWNFGKVKSLIVVYGGAFENLMYESFNNTIVHHEGFHAQCSYDDSPFSIKDKFRFVGEGFGIKSRKTEVATSVEEICAYVNQMSHPSFFECSGKFQKDIKSRLIDHLSLMQIYSEEGEGVADLLRGKLSETGLLEKFGKMDLSFS